MLRGYLDMAEEAVGLELDEFDLALVGHNLMHQVGQLRERW